MKTFSARLRDALLAAGLSVSVCSIFGKYIHIGVTNKDDYNKAIDLIQTTMHPKKITHLKGDNIGRHLDGGNDYRFCAIL